MEDKRRRVGRSWGGREGKKGEELGEDKRTAGRSCGG